MSEYLLLGMRTAAAAELSPARTGRHVAASAAWHQWLRRWGLLQSFALAPGDQAWPAGSFGYPAQPRAYLVVRASGLAVADRLAAGWARVAGYDVQVLPLRDARGGDRR